MLQFNILLDMLYVILKTIFWQIPAEVNQTTTKYS